MCNRATAWQLWIVNGVLPFQICRKNHPAMKLAQQSAQTTSLSGDEILWSSFQSILTFFGFECSFSIWMQVAWLRGGGDIPFSCQNVLRTIRPSPSHWKRSPQQKCCLFTKRHARLLLRLAPKIWVKMGHSQNYYHKRVCDNDELLKGVSSAKCMDTKIWPWRGGK